MKVTGQAAPAKIALSLPLESCDWSYLGKASDLSVSLQLATSPLCVPPEAWHFARVLTLLQRERAERS